jgi:uncharacterized membrane protein
VAKTTQLFFQKEDEMAVGPIQLIALTFEDFEPTGEILPALQSAMKSGAIRLVDLQFVGKDDQGNLTSMEMSGLSGEETLEFGAVIGGLIGAGVAGAEGAMAGSLEGALIAAEHNYGLSADELISVSDKIKPGAAAALLMIEHTWAIDFRDAVTRAGGQMAVQGFLTPDALFLVGAELEAQVEAVEAIEMAEAVKAMAAAEAVEAVLISEAIQQEAAQRAVAALVAAEIVEEAAIEEAREVVTVARIVEEAALEEAVAAVELAEEKKQAAEG